MGFQPAENDQAYAKFGFQGLQGSGKTFTAMLTAIGLHQLLTKRGVPGGGKTPIFMLDTETGSAFIAEKIKAAGIGFEVDRTRAMCDLIPSIEHVAQAKGILIIDSITAFWNEWKDTYIKKKNLRRGLQFNHWDDLKSEWRKGFTDPYLNSECHIFMCGRQGYEYGSEEKEGGGREIFKTAVRMKAESETGYEPSCLVQMDRVQKMGADGHVDSVWREAFVLKDRWEKIDGKCFRNPSFDSFLPHIEMLNLGGNHKGIDTTRTSGELVPAGTGDFRYEEEQRDIELDEIMELVKKHYPSQTNDDKQYRADLFEKAFQTRSWKAIEAKGLQELKVGRNTLAKLLSEPVPHSELAALTGETPFG